MNPSIVAHGRSTAWSRLPGPSAHRFQRFGFTLVEVVLALGLFAFAIVSLVSLLPLSLDAARNATETTRRSEAIQKVIAELSQSRFSNVVATTNLERTFTYDGDPTTPESKDAYFKVSVSVAPSTLLPGAEAASSCLARASLTVATPRQTMSGKTAITISDMGY